MPSYYASGIALSCNVVIGFLPVLLLLFGGSRIHGFHLQHRYGCSSRSVFVLNRNRQQKSRVPQLYSKNSSDQRDDDLGRLGFSKQEIERSGNRRGSEPVRVQVNQVFNVDAVTLTAVVGFGLIAANFFIFANMGDGGLAGLVATIINSLKE